MAGGVALTGYPMNDDNDGNDFKSILKIFNMKNLSSKKKEQFK